MQVKYWLLILCAVLTLKATGQQGTMPTRTDSVVKVQLLDSSPSDSINVKPSAAPTNADSSVKWWHVVGVMLAMTLIVFGLYEGRSR